MTDAPPPYPGIDPNAAPYPPPQANGASAGMTKIQLVEFNHAPLDILLSDPKNVVDFSSPFSLTKTYILI